MFDLLVNAEGGLTTAGYVVTISVGIVLFLAAVFFAGKRSKRQKMTTKQLVFCAAAMALAFVTSYVKIFQMPWGGSVTLCSMLFIVLVANWYGVGTGVLVVLLMESCSLYRNRMYFLFSKCAVIIFWHLQLLVWQDFLQKRSTDCLKVISRQFWQEVRFTHLGDICIGWITCPITSRNH